MYVPQSFAELEQETLLDFIEQRSFATLVTQDADRPVVSHIPLLLDRTTGTDGCLIGHMARANPQWRHMEHRSALAVFNGANAYISPAWYEVANAVPTWNYVAVHVYGTVRLEHDSDQLLQIVRRYVDFFEADISTPWSVDDADPEFIDKLLGAIVGFTIDIERIEGKWKLSQNHDRDRRTQVIRALRNAGGHDERQIADLMTATLEE